MIRVAETMDAANGASRSPGGADTANCNPFDVAATKPRIAHVVTTFYPGMAWSRTFHLAEDQVRQGWDVEFVTGCNASSGLLQQTRERGFPVTQIPSLTKYVHPLLDLKALFQLFRFFRNRRFNIVHTHLAKAGIIGRAAARMAGVPHIFHTVYGPTFAPTLKPFNRFTFLSLEKLAGKVTDKFIFVGQDLRLRYLRAGVCNPHNSRVIYGGRRLGPFIRAASLPEATRGAGKKTLGIDPETPLITYVARIVPSKGHLHAVRAFHQVKTDHVTAKLIFVGEARLPSEQSFKHQLIEEIRQLGLQDDVMFTGWVDNPAHYYGISDILIFPSLYEGLPGAVIEARAADLAIVAFDCGGVKEILGPDFPLARVGDTSTLAAMLTDRIAHLPENRKQRGSKMQELTAFAKTFSIKRMVEETRDLYQMEISNRCCSAAASFTCAAGILRSAHGQQVVRATRIT